MQIQKTVKSTFEDITQIREDQRDEASNDQKTCSRITLKDVVRFNFHGVYFSILAIRSSR